jgi:Zn-dependent protease
MTSQDVERAAADMPLTRTSRDALDRAASLAAERGSPSVGAIDVLRAILANRGSRATEAMGALGGDPAAIEGFLAAADGDVGPPLRQLLVNANREAQVLGHYQVDPVHLLLALLYSDSPATAAALQKAGLTLYDVRRQLQLGTATPEAAPAGARKRPDAALRRKPFLPLRGILSVSPVFVGLVAITLVSGGLLWFGVLPQGAAFVTIVFVTSGWVTSVCIHEFGHALAAYLGGDRGVVASGYLTLDPLRYTNLLVSIILPVVFLLLGGIALPGGAVYINQGALRSRAWSSLVSAAGPAGTLLFGCLVAIPFLIPGHASWVTAQNLDFFAALAALGFFQAAALVLNLLPIPGLDGFGILRPWLPWSAQVAGLRFSQFAIIGVFILLWYVAPARQAYFSTVLWITDFVGIDPTLIFFGLTHMRLF